MNWKPSDCKPSVNILPIMSKQSFELRMDCQMVSSDPPPGMLLTAGWMLICIFSSMYRLPWHCTDTSSVLPLSLYPMKEVTPLNTRR